MLDSIFKEKDNFIFIPLVIEHHAVGDGSHRSSVVSENKKWFYTIFHILPVTAGACEVQHTNKFREDIFLNFKNPDNNCILTV